MVDKEISEIAINHIDKKLKERIDELTAQRDTFIKLMDLYRNLSKGRKDVKQVVDYINELEIKLNKYKQALDEIEEMMKACTNQDICTLCPYSNSCRNPDDFCSYDPEKVILNIIAKAKGKKQC